MKERMIHITGNDLGFNLCYLCWIYGQILQLYVADCIMERSLVTHRYLIARSYHGVIALLSPECANECSLVTNYGSCVYLINPLLEICSAIK